MSSSEPELQPPLPLIHELEQLCAEWLEPQARRLREGRVIARVRVFNDALWGSIRLYPWEVAVLDTYLVQRLRRIRQLGVIHWVFHTATHTRFRSEEHTSELQSRGL